jgi:drug/metabolite transporter (DMT)-like permease
MNQRNASAARMAPHYRAILLIGVVTLLWAAIEVLGGLLPASMSLYQLVWMRYAIHVLILVVFFGVRARSGLWRTHRLLPQLGRGVLMLGMSVTFIVSVGHLAVFDTWAIFWLAPLLALAAAPWVLRERVPWATSLAAIAAYSGALILFRPQAAQLLPAAVLPLGMALCFALYLLATRWLRDEPILPSLFYTGLGVVVPLSLFLPFFWQPLDWTSVLGLTAISVMGLLLLYCLDQALALAPLSLLAPFLLLTPVWAVGLMRLLGHSVSLLRLGLGAVIIVSTLLTLIVYYKRLKAFATVAAAPPLQRNEPLPSPGRVQ